MSERSQFIRFLREIALSAAAAAVVILLVLIFSRNTDAYGAANILKVRRLHTAPTPRVVFIGGSGIAFGLDSDAIARATHLNPVNMGLYAGFGIDYLLAQASSGLRSGDTVVLVPEYDILTGPPSGDGFLVLEAGQAAPSSMTFAISNRATVIDTARSFPTWLSTRVISLAGRLLPKSDTLYHRVYRAGAFDAYGDDNGAERESQRLTASDTSTSSASTFEAPLNYQTLERISSFIAEERARGVRVYITWPVIPATIADIAAPQLSQNDAVIRSRFGDAVLGTQQEFVYPDGDFFDTVNHLAPSARTDRSKKIADLLKKAL